RPPRRRRPPRRARSGSSTPSSSSTSSAPPRSRVRSTRAATCDPVALSFRRPRAEVEGHGRTVEKYIGDAIVTPFGVPVGHEDDPERAVRAALAILDTVAALNAE